VIALAAIDGHQQEVLKSELFEWSRKHGDSVIDARWGIEGGSEKTADRVMNVAWRGEIRLGENLEAEFSDHVIDKLWNYRINPNGLFKDSNIGIDISLDFRGLPRPLSTDPTGVRPWDIKTGAMKWSDIDLSDIRVWLQTLFVPTAGDRAGWPGIAGVHGAGHWSDDGSTFIPDKTVADDVYAMIKVGGRWVVNPAWLNRPGSLHIISQTGAEITTFDQWFTAKEHHFIRKENRALEIAIPSVSGAIGRFLRAIKQERTGVGLLADLLAGPLGGQRLTEVMREFGKQFAMRASGDVEDFAWKLDRPVETTDIAGESYDMFGSYVLVARQITSEMLKVRMKAVPGEMNKWYYNKESWTAEVFRRDGKLLFEVRWRARDGFQVIDPTSGLVIAEYRPWAFTFDQFLEGC
jgi:hypothetical protein